MLSSDKARRADLMVWTPSGDELGREVRLNGKKLDAQPQILGKVPGTCSLELCRNGRRSRMCSRGERYSNSLSVSGCLSS
jgi:hypothetical protein